MEFDVDIVTEDTIIKEYNKTKLVNVVVNKLNVPIYVVTSVLRKRGIIKEVEASEIAYIIKNEEGLDLREFEKKFGFSKTQFSQICDRYNIGKVHKNQNEYTEEEIANQFRNLIENELKYSIDDDLPKLLDDSIFKNNGKYHLLKYAIDNQDSNKEYKYFSRIAYLTEIAYPGIFKGYQFEGKKKIQYFTKPIYCRELLYIIEKKLNIDIDNIVLVSQCNNFLKKDLLQYYGLGPNIYSRLFGTKKDMWEYFLSRLGMKDTKRGNTKILISNLEKIGVDVQKCFVSNCSGQNIHIHHIIPRNKKSKYSFDIDSQSNLIPLCPNHHYQVHKIDIQQWEKKIIGFNSTDRGDENRKLIAKIIETFCD